MNTQHEARTSTKSLGVLSIVVAWVILTLIHPWAIPSTMADGCYFPTKAIRKIPDIEAQRAVLHWNNGVETLVIASSLDSESQQLGWIIPLPSVPDTMEKADPGALKTLNLCVQPHVTHDLWQEAKTATIVVGIIVWITGTWLFRRERLLDVLLLLLLFGMFSGMLLSASGSAGRVAVKSPSAVRVEKSTRVGAYTISILSADTPQALNEWLGSHDLANLPDQALNIVADYIAQKWVFAAIQLVRDQAGPNTPHPVRLSFKTRDAVYPMRLTSLAGGSPYFELFVIAGQRAGHNLLPVEFSDQFRLQPNNSINTSSAFQADNSRISIRHPGVTGLMWDNCVVTKLSGRIPSEQMTNDLRITWHAPKAYRQHFFTSTGAAWSGYILFVVVAGLLSLVAMIRHAKAIKSSTNTIAFVARSVLASLGIGVLAAVVLYLAVPKLTADQVQLSRRWHTYNNTEVLTPHITETLDNLPGWSTMTEDELAAIILKGLAGKTNSISGDEFLHESTPGNFTLHKTDKILHIAFYDRTGRSSRVKYPLE